MSPELKAFLTAEDLDELSSARRMITALDDEDAAVVRLTLQQWDNPQAVANLLFNPNIIPEDLRLASLFRGVGERQVVYYVLAAVVGFQSIDPAELVAEERGRVVAELLAILRKTSGILAQRASVSFQPFAREDDAPRVFALWAHPDDTVWHNLRAWLFRTFQNRGIEPFTAAIRQSGLADNVQQRLIDDFTEFVTDLTAFQGWLLNLFGYLPNLRGATQST